MKRNAQLPSVFYMTSQKMISSEVSRIKHQHHQSNHFLCMNLWVLCAVLIALKKLRELYSKEMLNRFEVTKAVLTSILMNAVIFSICPILSNKPHHYFFIVLLIAHMTKGGRK